MKKILVIPLLFIAVALSAAPIGENRAREIALSFFAKSATRSSAPAVELAWAGDNVMAVKERFNASATNLDESLLYIYNRTDAKGYVVVAGDDTVRPIIAFSHENSMNVSNLPAGARAMLSAWSKQVAASRAGKVTPIRQTRADDGVGEVVKKYETAQWNQGAPFNNYAPVYDGYASVTGCVATALSIVCRYNEWPDKGVGTSPSYDYTDYGSVHRTIEANTLGHSYDYANMRMDNYEHGYNATEANAVATLMKDVGRAVKMSYHYTASGASDTDAFSGMINHFKYSKSARIASGNDYNDSEWTQVITSNISKCGPMYFSGHDGEGGHAFVLDGYTSGGYVSVNYGWGGSANGYYLLPGLLYMLDQKAFLDFVPDRDGTSQYADNLSWVSLQSSYGGLAYSGLVPENEISTSNSSCSVDYGGVYNIGVATFTGYLRLAHCDKNGVVKSVPVPEFMVEIAPASFSYGTKTFAFGAGVTIAEGDKLVMQYRGANSSEWHTMGRYDENCSSEILLKASPERIAEILSVSYVNMGARYGYQIHLGFADKRVAMYLPYEVKDSSGISARSGVILPHTIGKIPTASYHGEYTISLSCGGTPYTFSVVLK